MINKEWQERTFWDGNTSIFINNHGRISCYDIDSEKLHGIIEMKIAECDREKSVWIELQQKYKDTNG